MHLVFWFKFLLAFFALGASLFLVFGKSAWLEKPPGSAIVVYYTLRIAFLAVLLLGFKFGYPGENMGMYYYYAHLVLHGAVPDRDFFMLYGILFPDLLAIAVRIWDHRFALILLFQLVEFAAVYALFTQRNVPMSRGDFLRYAFNPVVLVWLWLGLQNQIMCLIPIAAAFALRGEIGRNALFALGFALSKIFALWTILPALLVQRARSAIVFGVALLVIYVPFLLLGSTGISFKATEATGSITDDASHSGIESWVGLIPSAPWEAGVTHGMLRFTALLLLVVLLAACFVRLKFMPEAPGPNASFARDLAFTAIFATLLTLVYQAFATYTTPDYLTVAIVVLPFLVTAKFWTQWDQVFFAVVCYLQATVYLLWFHLPEFGVRNPRENGIFLVFLILVNIGTIGLCGLCACRTWTFFAPLRR
jgi:hypothetical protein